MKKQSLLITFFWLSGLFVSAQPAYKADILGNGFQQLTINQPDDYEGKVVCTIIRKMNDNPTSKAVLYVHGFNDYFFQEEMAEQFLRHGYNFYAIDLRKYGRSWLPNQKITNARDLKEYYADIDTALKIIQAEGNQQVLLSGHSTGGLTVSLYANDHQKSDLFDAVFANSPFYNMNMSFIVRALGVPIVSCQGKRKPDALMHEKDNIGIYGSSLHRSAHGEWNFNTNWKQIVSPEVTKAWVRAIHKGQIQARKGFVIDKPILVLHSSKSVYGKVWDTKFFEGDAVLNVKYIDRRANNIKGDCEVKIIENGMHDLILSPKPVRENTYQTLFQWLDLKFK
jgi:alpha-beta hydrolase superfamily lysophospholipase